MRAFTFDNFNTWHDWRLTLTARNTTPPMPKTNYVELGGVSGTLDLSEALSGEVAYNDRTVTASFWTSEGDFTERIMLLGDINRALHGKKVKIVEPDDPEHYFLGRVCITKQAYDQVHAEFTIEAICDPWRYAVSESHRAVEVDGNEVDVAIHNNGVKTLCPNIAVEGTVTITYEGASVELTDGVYRIADIKLRQGVTLVTVSGTGSVEFIYREAGL